MSLEIYHGSTRRRYPSAGLLENDVVITTYDTLKSEWRNQSEDSVLFRKSEMWARVVLDEGMFY